MKISIITATYNRGETIERAIRSVQNQDYDNIELVIVDGASVDDTCSKVMSLLGQNDTFVSEKDKGIYDALNKGINRSSGDVIGFMHSDDMYVDNNVLSRVANIFDDDVDIVYGDACFFSGSVHTKYTRIYRSNRLTLKNLAWGKMPPHTAMFVKKSVYGRHGLFKTNYSIAGDYEFLCRLMKAADIKAIYLPRLLVKMQNGGVSTGGLSNTILLNREVIRACNENGIYTNLFMIISKYPSKILQFFKK